MRLEASDRADIDSFRRELAVIDLDGPPVLELITQRLHRLLRTESALVYGIAVVDEEPSLERFAVHGHVAPMAESIRRGLEHWARATSGICGWYDVRQPDPAQRNVPVVAGTARQAAEESKLRQSFANLPLTRDEKERRMQAAASLVPYADRWGVSDAEQLRTLICDGPVLLAWVGSFQHGSHDRRDVRVFEAVVPAIQRRLALDARLDAGPASLLVPVLLDHIPGAAFIVDARHRIAATNAAGRQMIASQPQETRAHLRAARRRGGDGRFTCVELASKGIEGHALLVERPLESLPTNALALVSRRFGLTPRETEVLGALARGHTNRAISVALGCSERTVETHVSRVLAKTDSNSRSALAALLWSTVH